MNVWLIWASGLVSSVFVAGLAALIRFITQDVTRREPGLPVARLLDGPHR